MHNGHSMQSRTMMHARGRGDNGDKGVVRIQSFIAMATFNLVATDLARLS